MASVFMDSKAVSRAHEIDADEQERMVRFLRGLVMTPSPSTEEKAVAEMIVDELRDGGIENVRIDKVGNVLAHLGDGQGPMLLYDAHMDTVLPVDGLWPGGGPYEAFVRDGTLFGLGSCDMKGAIAAMVYGARALSRAEVPWKGSLVLAFVVQEEPCEGCALKALMAEESLTPNWVVLGEPSDMNIVRGHRGRVLFKTKVRGKSSHASSPHLGDNAVSSAARLIFGIEMLNAELPTDPFLGSGTISVTHIESQSASMNAVPGLCVVYLDRRLTLGETVSRARAQIETIIQRERIDAEVEVVEYGADSYTGFRLEALEAFNSWAIEESHPLIHTLGAGIQAISGHIPTRNHLPFSTDGVYTMGELGIPTVGFGPGSPQHAHTSEDQVRLSDVAQAARVYALLAAMLLAEGAR